MGGWVVKATHRPGKTRYPLYRKLGGPKERSGQVRKFSPLPGFDPRTVQPIASRLPPGTYCLSRSLFVNKEPTLSVSAIHIKTNESFELLHSGYKSIWRFPFDTEDPFHRYGEDDYSLPFNAVIKMRGATTPLRHTPSRRAQGHLLTSAFMCLVLHPNSTRKTR
jgi:hypothetical protein